LDNISLSIRNYQLNYDSISTAITFDNYNLEGQKTFETYVSVINPLSSGVDGAENQPDTTAGPSTSTLLTDGELDSNQEQLKSFLSSLKTNLDKYRAYLNKHTIAQEVWSSDIDYINDQLGISIGLTDFSVVGLEGRIEKYVNLYQLKDNEKIREQIKAVLDKYGHVLRYNVMTVPPVQVQDYDRLTYSLGFYKNGKKTAQRDYMFNLKSGFKIDFSTGFTHTSLNSDAFTYVPTGTRNDTTYYRDDYFVTTDSITGIQEVNLYKLKKLGNSQVNIGVTALLHFYSRTGRLVNIGGVMGLTFDTKTDFKYLVGGSLMLGQQQRIVLSGGLAIGTVDRLNPKYNYDESVFTQSDITQVSESQLTLRQREYGYFLSVTYNLGTVLNANQ
jgi:hypothetical protein